MKQSMKRMYMMCAMLFTFVFFMGGVKAEAAEISQTDQTKDSVTISWTPGENALNYKIYIKSTSDGRSFTEIEPVAELAADQTSYTLTGLTAGNTYDVKIVHDVQSGSSVFTWTLASTKVKTLPGKVKKVRQQKWWYYIKSVDVTWKKQPDVSGYEWKMYVVNGKKWKKFDSGSTKIWVGSTNYKISPSKTLSNEHVYSVKMRAYQEINGQVYYGPWSAKAYLFTQPMIQTAGILRGGKLRLVWNKVNGATGYDVYVSTKEKKGYKKVKSVSSKVTSATIAKLKKKSFTTSKEYYVYIVAKKKVGKKTYTSGRHYTYSVKGRRVNWTFDK